MSTTEHSSEATPLIGDFDHALLTEIRLVVGIVFGLALTLLMGWTLLPRALPAAAGAPAAAQGLREDVDLAWSRSPSTFSSSPTRCPSVTAPL